MFLLVLFFMILLLIYFFFIGYLTILESSILAFFQVSKGISSINGFNLYHFYLDFLKLMIKGINSVYFLYLMFLFFVLFMVFISFMFLPLNYFSFYSIYGILFYLIFDSGLIFFKVSILIFMGCKIVFLFCEKLKYLFILMEGLYMSFFLFFIFYLTGFDKGCCWMSVFVLFKKYELLINGVLALFFVLFFLISLFKLFSIPFDYFEVESEMVGGGVLEFYGMSFALWSLIEYGLLANSVLLLCIIFPILSKVSIMIFNFVIIMVLFSSGVLISMSFFSILIFSIKLYLFLLILFLCIFGFYFIFMYTNG